jgi:hypothetical protein
VPATQNRNNWDASQSTDWRLGTPHQLFESLSALATTLSVIVPLMTWVRIPTQKAMFIFQYPVGCLASFFQFHFWFSVQFLFYKDFKVRKVRIYFEKIPKISKNTKNTNQNKNYSAFIDFWILASWLSLMQFTTSHRKKSAFVSCTWKKSWDSQQYKLV